MQKPTVAGAAAQIAQQAVSHQQAGRYSEALAAWQRAVDLVPGDAAFNYSLAAVCFALGDWGRASTHAERATQADPRSAPAHLLLGASLLERKAFEAALPHLRQAVMLKSDFVEAQTTLGIALRAIGSLDEAESVLRHALSLQPGRPHIHVSLGKVLAARGEREAAVSAFSTALTIDPNDVEALSEMGKTLCALDRAMQGIAFLERGLSLQPNNPALQNSLGAAYLQEGVLSQAEACFGRAMQLNPNNAEAVGNFAMWHARVGRIPEAAQLLATSLRIKPDVRTRISLDLMLPHIMGTREEVLASRARYATNLDRLIDDKVQVDEPHRGIIYSNFYLAYHGLDDLPLQKRFADLCYSMCPALRYEGPAERAGRRPGRKRIGFLSQHIYLHSVSLCFSRIVAALAKNGNFVVSLISTYDSSRPEVAQAYPDFQGKHVRIPNDISRARQQIAEMDLDVLVYLDIGMDTLGRFLALSRLAREQYVLGGHPVTTGMANMDYFVSSAISELPHADSHYSERLIRLPMGVFYFERPSLPSRFAKTRRDFGLPEEGQLYICPVRLQKMHPDFDAVMARILAADPTGRIVVFHDHQWPAWSAELSRRFELTMPKDLLKRIVFLPWISDTAEFANINALADVVLDPLHFGIGSTAVWVYAVGTPIVTLPGEFLRGRSAYFFCQLMELPECVAEDVDDYVKRAVTIARDRELATTLRQRILANNGVIFDNARPIHDMAALFN